MDLTEAEDIKKRWQQYTEELYKKDLNDPDNHDGVITHLEPDILECEVKWALESITRNKASGGDGIPVDLFQVLKDGAVKVLHSICQQWPQDWKMSVLIPIPKKGNAKECSYYCTIALISNASKEMLTYRVIITIFLNSIYICISILYWCFSFWLTSLCIISSSFIHLIRTDSNVFFLMAE